LHTGGVNRRGRSTELYNLLNIDGKLLFAGHKMNFIQED